MLKTIIARFAAACIIAAFLLSCSSTATVDGIARDAALGAVIVKDDGAPVYIGGLSEWPQEVSGKRVHAMGVLIDKKLAPDPQGDRSGAVSHGMQGVASVLEKAKWSVIDK